MAENTIGQAYIEIIPTTDGITGAMESALGGAGSKAGASFGGGFKAAAATAMGNLASSAVSAAASAAADFGRNALNAGKDFDNAMSQVAATMGKSAEDIQNDMMNTETELGRLRAFALEMGGTTAFSTTEAAEALNYMALAGYDADTSIAMLPNVLNLAASGAMGLAEASDMVTDVSSALGLSIEETTVMVDQMAATASASNTSVAQLGAAMLKIGGTAANMKGGTQELATALGILANNGIKSAEGGTHLRNMLLSLETPGDKAAMALERIGLNEKFVYDEAGNLRGMDEIFTDLSMAMTGMTNAEKDATLAAVFNKTDLSAARAMLAGISTSFDDLGGALEKSGVDWEKYADKVWATEGVIEGISGDIAYDIAQGFSDAEIADYLVSEYEIDTTDAIAAINAAKSAVVDSGTAWDSLNASIGDAKGAAEDMANAQLENLEGDITKFDSALMLAYQTVFDKLSPSLRELVQFGTDGISQLTAAFNEGGLEGLLTTLGELVSQGTQKLLDAAPQMMEAAFALASSIGKGFMDNMPKLLDTVLKLVGQLAQDMAAAAPEMIPAAVEMVMNLALGLLDNIDMIIDSAIALVTGLATGLVDALPILLEKAPEIIQKLVDALLVNVPKLLEAAVMVVVTLVEGIIQNLPMLLEAAFEIIGTLIAGAIEQFPAVIDMCLDLVSQMYDFFLNVDTSEWGKDLIQGLVDGIMSMIGKVADAAKAVAESIAKFIHFSEPDVGPLANFHTFAPDMMELFAKGIKDNEDIVAMQVSKSFDLHSAMGDARPVSPVYDSAVNVAGNDTSGLYSLMSRYLPEIAAADSSVNVSLEGDAAGIFDLVRRQNRVYTRANGRSAFA